MLGAVLALFGPRLLAPDLRLGSSPGGAYALRAGAAFLVGSMLAGAILGAMKPGARRLGPAVGVGILAAAVMVGIVRVALAAWVPLSVASVCVPLALAVLVGIFAGLIVDGVSSDESVPAGDTRAGAAAEWVYRIARWSRRPSRRKERRRGEALRHPFPPEWIPVLEHAVPAYHRLTEEQRQKLREQVLVFLHEMRFEGCAGVEITDEIRVTVAAQACLLSLNLEGDSYAGLRSILIYPSSYVARVARPPAAGEIAPEDSVNLGESWAYGTVVLAWDSVLRGAHIPNDGKNLVMHEFAHQLDQEDGRGDGVPFLRSASSFPAWTRVLERDFSAHQKRSNAGRARVLSEYGATNPAEFFAVATECFFEKPRELERKFPEMYGELAGYFGQDPARWPPAADRVR